MEAPRPTHQLEMNTYKTNGNYGAPQETKQELPADCVDGAAIRKRDDPEREGLLRSPAVASTDYGNGRQEGFNSTSTFPVPKGKQNKKVRLLWVGILIVVLIISVILLSLYLCSVIYEDPDENYDPRLFDVHWNFSVNFRLPNLNFTEDILSLASNDSHPLAAELQSKLDHVYTTSPALGRYFLNSQVYKFSDSPLTAWMKLIFLLPAAEKDQLTRFTLSRDMIYNILRQFLYDQEDTSDRMYVEPASLKMWG